MSDKTLRYFDTKTQQAVDVKLVDNLDGTFSFSVKDVGGMVQFGHIPVVTNGLNADATEGDLPGNDQRVQLPDIPCRKVVIAYPNAGIPPSALPNDYGNGTANATGRLLYYGDAAGQFWALDMGDVEELEVSNANQVFLRDVAFDWQDFNSDGPHSTAYAIVAFWRLIK